MEEQQIQQIISLGEGKQIEFKSAKSVLSDLYETIVSESTYDNSFFFGFLVFVFILFIL
jgi:hypothetical protein